MSPYIEKGRRGNLLASELLSHSINPQKKLCSGHKNPPHRVIRKSPCKRIVEIVASGPLATISTILSV